MTAKREKALKIFKQLSAAVDAGNVVLAVKQFNELCDALGWGAAEFSEKLNISDQSFYRWKKGAKLPRKSNLEKIEHFLRNGDLEWSGARLNPLELGIQTWKHMAARAERHEVTETWVFSAEEFLEGKVSEARTRMSEVILSKNKGFFYVFPEDSSAASTWRRWMQSLKYTTRPPGAGQVVGVKVKHAHIDQLPMFIHGVYVVLYHYSPGKNEGFLAFSVNPETLNLLAAQENDGKHPDIIWMQVDDELANAWYDTYCIQIKSVFEAVGSDNLVIPLDFTADHNRLNNGLTIKESDRDAGQDA